MLRMALMLVAAYYLWCWLKGGTEKWTGQGVLAPGPQPQRDFGNSYLPNHNTPPIVVTEHWRAP